MKIDEVVNALRKKYMSLKKLNSDSTYKPNLVIYMEHEYYDKCKYEIQGQVSREGVEFINSDTLMGFPVWPIVPRYARGDYISHPPFVIVNLGDD